MGGRGVAATGLAGGLITVVVAGGLTSAGAAPKLDSFAGSCSLKGDVTFSPPVKNTEQRLSVAYDAGGTCSGTLDGRPVSNARVKLHHSGHSEGSCMGARTTGPGHGTIAFADGTVVRYPFEFTATGTEVDFRLRGQRSGAASGHGTFLT